MKCHFCDVCGDDLTGERMHLLDMHYYSDEAQKVPSIPIMELCPMCKEWLRECITMKRDKEANINEEE